MPKFTALAFLRRSGVTAASGTPHTLKTEFAKDHLTLYDITEEEAAALNLPFQKTGNAFHFTISDTKAATDLIVAEIFPDREALALRNITDEKKYFDAEVAALNVRSAPHKKIGLVKIREVEFEKTTTRKITRFSIDKTVD